MTLLEHLKSPMSTCVGIDCSICYYFNSGCYFYNTNNRPTIYKVARKYKFTLKRR